MGDYKLFDAEYRLMDIVWDKAPICSGELCKVCFDRLGWKKSTTYTMIKKLAEKGLLENKKATVTAIVEKEEIQRYESETLLQKSFDSSLPSFVAAFLKGKKISKKEAEELKKMIEEAVE